MPQLSPPHIKKDDGFGNTITLIHSGQVAAYRGSLWVGSVHCSRDELNHIDMVRALIQDSVGEGYIFPDGVAHPFYRPEFKMLKQSESDPHTWDFRVERVYLD
jgi:hypothetical protein